MAIRSYLRLGLGLPTKTFICSLHAIGLVGWALVTAALTSGIALYICTILPYLRILFVTEDFIHTTTSTHL